MTDPDRSPDPAPVSYRVDGVRADDLLVIDDGYRRDEAPLGMRIAGAVASVLLGALTGAIGTLAHQLTTSVGSFAAPTGLLAACLAVVLLIAGLRLAMRSRLYAALAALGVVAMVALLALPTASGSAILPANLRGVVWAVGPTLLAAIVLAWPSGLRARRTRTGRRPGHASADEILGKEEELHQ